MDTFSEIPEWSSVTWGLGLACAILLVLVARTLIEGLVANIAAGIGFRLKGFHVRQTIMVDGELATITRIGTISTDFFVMKDNGKRHEFSVVENSRLKFLTMRQLVRRYPGDNGHNPGGE